ncbi:DEAD/DEAH box helicase [Sedimentibacter saalensis]|jgi:ATP-dependent RNA helicase DeaD|uniref:ATP-dependent RNA helicase DeaD n=1 Tax=Sedimentibacter saalensis TaxID=130788 RepID=A0A562JHX4_9FIRM|nr:DEAD/DEAH box helicase [Sedimentibacter saalensis]MEA5094563.1 DEAD/DEAH box helicase [Sedimentibacter saalensis]TWH82761.1 ATP-dependent RNA helicase DeaD [Sedimentibacter saalensis]
MKIENVNLNDNIQKALQEMGFEESTQIQQEAIPVVLEGHDIIGQSNTGTGKTAAFGIPILEKIDTRVKLPQALVLLPTRELAVQVANEFRKIGKYMDGIKTVTVYGGADIRTQINKVKEGAQIIVGTPGRIIDLIDRHVIKLNELKITVLDEADEMLKMGFREDIELILSNVDHVTQTLLFSATIPDDMKKIIKKFLKNPVSIKTLREGITAKEVKQSYFLVKHSDKVDALARLIDTYTPKLTLVFCNTKKSVDDLYEVLIEKGYNCDKIHGDIKQSQRIDTLTKFNNGLIDILIATDVAARGLDIKEVECVINFEVPSKEDYYVHRIGRTGRAGKEGSSFTLASAKEIKKIENIEKYTKKPIRKRTIPTVDKVNEVKQDKFIRGVVEIIEKGDIGENRTLAGRLLEQGYDAETLIAAMIKKLVKFDTSEERDLNDIIPERKKISRGAKNLEDTVRFHVSLGKKQGIRPGDILGAVAGECGIPGSDIGEIEVLENYSFFNAASEHQMRILDRMQGAQIKGKDVMIELSKEKKSSRPARGKSHDDKQMWQRNKPRKKY